MGNFYSNYQQNELRRLQQGGLTKPGTASRQKVAGPAGTNTTPAYSARNSGSSMPSLGTGDVSQPAKPASLSAAMGSMSSAMPRGGNSATLQALQGEPQSPQQSGQSPFNGIMSPIMNRQPTQMPEVANLARQQSPVQPTPMEPAAVRPSTQADIRNFLTQGMDEARQGAIAARDAREGAVLSDLSSAVSGLRSGAESQMLQPGQGVPQQPAARQMLKSHIGENGMAYLASDTTGTGPREQPERPGMRALPDVNPGEKGNTSGITRYTDPNTGQITVLGRNADKDEQFGTIRVKNPNGTYGQVVMPSSGNSLGLRQIRNANTITSQSGINRMQERLNTPTGNADQDAANQERLARFGAYEDRRDKRYDESRAIRTEAAGLQNYGQNGSVMAGMQAGPMGTVSPLYAATYGPNMSRGQALRMGREELQDPTGENRQERYARGQAAMRDPAGFLGNQIDREQMDLRNQIDREQMDLRNQIAQGEMQARGVMAQADKTRADAAMKDTDAQIEATKEALRQSRQMDPTDWSALVSDRTLDPRVRRMLMQNPPAQFQGTGTGTVLAPGQQAAPQSPLGTALNFDVTPDESGNVPDTQIETAIRDFTSRGISGEPLLAALENEGISRDMAQQYMMRYKPGSFGRVLQGLRQSFTLPGNEQDQAAAIQRENAPVNSLLESFGQQPVNPVQFDGMLYNMLNNRPSNASPRDKYMYRGPRF